MQHQLTTRQEELEASVTHGAGLLLSLIGAYVLLRGIPSTTDPLFKTACVVYVSTLLLVYAASTMSHMYSFQSINTLLRRCDQGFIYLLIVGTATPFISMMLSSIHTQIVVQGLYILTFLWGLAFVGCLSKIVFGHRLNNVAVSLYVLLGWGEALALILARSEIEQSSVCWLIAGGLFYTIGIIFLVLDWQKYHFHTIWHLLVIAGSFSHFISIMVLAT